MISYRDMTFCTAECDETQCHRNKQHLPDRTELPVAFASFTNCEDWPEGEDDAV